MRLKKNQEALKDFNAAIAGWEQSRPSLLRGDGLEWDRRQYAVLLRIYNRNLAVMRHHRGEAYEKLGKAEAARQDYDWAQQHGYNPAEGAL